MAEYYFDEGKWTKVKDGYTISKKGSIVKSSKKKKKKKDEDIAPVKGGNKNSIFKSGGFSDGVDGIGDFFGDLGETIVAKNEIAGLRKASLLKLKRKAWKR